MQLAMRRAIAIGGATFVAVGATLALSLPASAHTNTTTVSCTDGVSTLHVSLQSYNNTHGPNSVTVTDKSGNNDSVQLYHADDFTPGYNHSFTEDGTVTQVYHLTVVPSGGQLAVDQDYTTAPCPKTPPTTTTTTVPPTTTTTTAPPTTTTTKGGILPTTVPPTTTAVLATGTAPLPNTGVSATMPLTIGGALLVAGGGILLWMRMSAKRRRTS
jgi:LPXTG-motif cell wall-anchored protein